MEAPREVISPETVDHLSKNELKDIVNAYGSGERLSTGDVMGLMSYNPNRGNTNTEILASLGIPGSLIVGHVALETVIEHDPTALPTFGHLPTFLHQLLTNVAELPFFDQSEPTSTAFRDHAPNLLLFAAGSYLGLEAAKFINNRSFHKRAKSAQESVAQAYREGSLAWRIEPGSAVAFIGDGDPLAKKIASIESKEILQISHVPIEGPWTKLPPTATFSEILQALDRADIGNAGELQFVPITPSHEFLPGDGDYDINIDRMVNYILAADVYRSRLGLDKLPVTIIGSKNQSETYIDAANTRTIIRSERTVTLGQRMAALSEDRECGIQIIDPTEIIIDRVLEIAQGKKLVLSGTEASVQKYANQFFASTLGHQGPVNGDYVRVLYNHDDLPTVSDATPEDIAVVIDPEQKQLLMYRGIPEERILIVSEEVLRAVPPLVSH